MEVGKFGTQNTCPLSCEGNTPANDATPVESRKEGGSVVTRSEFEIDLGTAALRENVFGIEGVAAAAAAAAAACPIPPAVDEIEVWARVEDENC